MIENLPTGVTFFEPRTYLEKSRERKPTARWSLSLTLQIRDKRQIMELDYTSKKNLVNALRKLEKNAKYLTTSFAVVGAVVLNNRI